MAENVSDFVKLKIFITDSMAKFSDNLDRRRSQLKHGAT